MSIKFTIKKKIFIFIILMSYKSNIFVAASPLISNTKKPGFFGGLVSSAVASVKNDVKKVASNVVHDVKQSVAQVASQGVSNIVNSVIQPSTIQPNSQISQNIVSQAPIISQVPIEQTTQPSNNNSIISQIPQTSQVIVKPELIQSVQQPVQVPTQMKPEIQTHLEVVQVPVQQSTFQNIQENNLKNNEHNMVVQERPIVLSENIIHAPSLSSNNIVQTNPETQIHAPEIPSNNNIIQTNTESQSVRELNATKLLAAKLASSKNMPNTLNNASNLINKSSKSDIDIAKNQVDLNKSIKNSVLDNNPSTMTKIKRESQSLWTNANKLYDKYVPQQVKDSLSSSKDKIQSSLVQGAVNIVGSANNLVSSNIDRGTKELNNQTTNLVNKIDSGINLINKEVDNVTNNMNQQTNILTNKIDNISNKILNKIDPVKQEIVDNSVIENKSEVKKTLPILSKILNQKVEKPINAQQQIINSQQQSQINNNIINKLEEHKIELIKDEGGNPVHLIKYNDLKKQNEIFNLKLITA